MSLATLAQNLAVSQIARYGAAATLSRSSIGTYNTSTRTSTDTPTTYAVSAVLDSKAVKGLGFKFGHDLIQGGEIQATIPAKGLAITPAPGDKLTVGAVTYSVVDVRPIYVMDQVATYELLVRR